jgi:MFS family permease
LPPRTSTTNHATAGDVASVAAWAGLVALAVGMGIGRFAFTPLFPLMLEEQRLTVVEGGRLAGVNYAGYLIGAVACFFVRVPPLRAVRWGLAAVAATTLAMSFASQWPAWAVLRGVAGVASALLLVGVSGWLVPLLAEAGRPQLAGVVYAGVGAGMALAGAAGSVASLASVGSAATWLILGTVATLAGWWCAQRLHALEPRDATPPPAPGTDGLNAREWVLVACYGMFGFGYILPATFLPAVARTLADDPAVFGLTWPVFGLAAAASTLAAAPLLARFGYRRAWAASHLVMAAGLLAQLAAVNALTIAVTAVCVGGTFMVATMAGLQEARRVAGARATRMMAAMTAAFAIGQMIGPLLLQSAGSVAEAVAPASLGAVVLLVTSALVLLRVR